MRPRAKNEPNDSPPCQQIERGVDARRPLPRDVERRRVLRTRPARRRSRAPSGPRRCGPGSGVGAGDAQSRRRPRIDREFEPLRRAAGSVQVAEEAPERIGRRIDAAGEVEGGERLHVDDERRRRDLDAALGQRLVDAGVERAIAVGPQPRIAVGRVATTSARRIAEEAAAEALVERRRAIGVADMAADLGAGCAGIR